MMTLYFFTSPTCGPCKQIKPQIERMCNDRKISLELVDVSDNSQKSNYLKNYYGVTSVPHFVLVKEGKGVIGYRQGAGSVPVMEKFLEGK